VVEEIAEAGLALEDSSASKACPCRKRHAGTGWLTPPLQIVLDTARAIERVPELLGLSPHLIHTARRPSKESR
jgi:hypothetical protein